VEILFSNVGWVVGIIGEGGATVNRKKKLETISSGPSGEGKSPGEGM
jgi:hypothetical protein